ncbi:NAD-dependent epimerase/dehydratase family protein [Candidatus Bipolaricaulota bacterium]|nr:NAD-dependent epimerase/dehydratase family protein [Candidatus Bipolaricaulota bacterium]
MVIGACGQIGSELTTKLSDRYSGGKVIAADKCAEADQDLFEAGRYSSLDVLDKEGLRDTIKTEGIDTVFNLAAILSAKGEEDPKLAFQVNTIGLHNTLEVGKELGLDRIVVPSSIAVFGPEMPKDETPDEVYLRPRSMYGITKVTGELLGYYYWEKYGLDVRELRLPGIVSHKTLPGGGTTDYAVEAFYRALTDGYYEFFVREDTRLPMMYMPDCIKSLIQLAEAKPSSLKSRTNYNVRAMSFSAGELAREIDKRLEDFNYDFSPDYRQDLADSWPNSVDDSSARAEWGWQPEYGLEEMVEDMLINLKDKLAEKGRVN